MDDRLKYAFATLFVAISLYFTWAGGLKSLKILLDCLSRRRTAWLSFSGSRRGRTGLVCGLCCVNPLVCAHTLWPPRVRPAPASPTARLGRGVCCDGDNYLFRRTVVIADGDLPPTKRVFPVAMALETTGRDVKLAVSGGSASGSKGA